MWLFVFNLLGVVAFFVMPGIASYGYLVTQETTYQEFIRVGAIDEEQLAKLTPPEGSVGSG